MQNINEVKIIVQGPVGSSKTALLRKIETALVGVDVKVEWEKQQDATDAHAMHPDDIDGNLQRYAPTVKLVERTHFQSLDDIVPLALNVMERIQENPDTALTKSLYDRMDQIQKDLNNLMSQMDVPGA